jgi:hypothetical protein
VITAQEVHEWLLSHNDCPDHTLADLFAEPIHAWVNERVADIRRQVAGQQRAVDYAFHRVVAACEEADPDWPFLVSMGFSPISRATSRQRRLFARHVAGHPLEWALWLKADRRDLQRWLLYWARPRPGWTYTDTEEPDMTDGDEGNQS